MSDDVKQAVILASITCSYSDSPQKGFHTGARGDDVLCDDRREYFYMQADAVINFD